MPKIDTTANELFDELLCGKSVRFRPCVSLNKEKWIGCSCGSLFESAYMENGLYAIRCARCKTVSFIRARNPLNAAGAFGYIHRPAMVEEENTK